MLIKMLSRHANGAQLIKYALRYVTKEKKESHKENVKILVQHHLRGTTVDNLVQEFAENEKFRLTKRKNSVSLYHSIISFHKHNRNDITLPMLTDIAKHFIKLRAPNCISLAVAHLEKEHLHCHIVTSGTQINGRSARMSKAQLTQLLVDMEQYQQERYPQLEKSKIDHIRKTAKDRSTVRAGFSTNRQSIAQSLYTMITQSYSSAGSVAEFLHQLSGAGYEPYYRNGVLQGVIAHNKKFRFITLGFDKAQLLAELRHKETVGRELQEIQKLRNKSQAMEKQEIQKKPIQSPFTELQKLRLRALDYGGKERAQVTTQHHSAPHEQALSEDPY